MALPGFDAALARKYNLQEQEIDSRARLTNAQADAIPLTTQSENALRGAQAYQTTQQGAQVAPLAQSQIGEAAARGGYYGAEGRLADVSGRVAGLGFLTLPGAAADAVGRNFQRDNQTPATPGPVASTTSTYTGSVYGPPPVTHVTDAHGAAIYNGHPMVQAFGGNTGASDEALSPKAFTGTNQFGFQGGDQLGETPEPGAAGFKKGSANIKGAKPKGLAGLMASLGSGGAGAQTPMPGSPMSAPMPSPMAGGAPAPMPMSGQPLGMMAGTPQVPGVGSGNVDKVPAMLAPHEAVLTHGAADALGRGKIAALNAKHPPTLPTKKPPLKRGMV